MPDENDYPTLKFMRCRKCGSVFVAGYSGDKECPDCSSYSTEEYQGDMADKRDDGEGAKET